MESRKKQYTADYNQMGYIKIIEVILKNEPQIMDIDESRTLAHYLIEKCLFFSEIPPLDNHFLKGTDLESLEAPYLNKCKSFLCRD